MITKQDIEKAHVRLEPIIHNTPILSSTYINAQLGAEVYFKCENFQKTGSFKARGATNSVLKLSADQKEKGVATHSSGNHGQALAWAAAQAGVKCWVVMPSNAPQVKKDAVKGYGAEVIECVPTLQAREEGLKEIQNRTGATFIPPFNFQNTIEGQSTASYELFTELKDLDFLLTPVGGGGLLSGSGLSASYFSPSTKVIGCEPENADDAWQSFRAGKIIPVMNPNTVADGLKTSLGDLTFGYIQKHISDIHLCSEKEIMAAMKMIWERMKIIVEPSCAVPLACALRNKDIYQGKKIAIILSGGNVDLERMFN